MIRFAFIAALAVATSAPASAQLADFPFERELLLEAQPMRPGKRMPSLSIEPNGRASLDLWCRSIPARIQLGEGTITVQPAVAAEELAQVPLPAMQSAGQCTEPRIAADAELLGVLAGATQWRMQRDIVVIEGGARPLRFRPAGN